VALFEAIISGAQKVDISALGPAPLFSLGMNVTTLRAAADVHKWRAAVMSKKLTGISKALKEATCELEPKKSEVLRPYLAHSLVS